MQIYIYASQPSVDKECAGAVYSALLDFGVDPYNVKVLGTPQALGETLEREPGVLILPGGHTAYLHMDFTDANLTYKVKQAVRAGWNCLGFCAGANILCEDAILYKQGRKMGSFANFRPLANIMPGIVAHIPSFSLASFQSEGTNNSRIITLQTEIGSAFQCVWSEGGAFAEANGAQASGLAYYDNSALYPTAVVERRFGKGTVVVSGPHPELPFSAANAVETGENAKHRLAFLHDIFRTLGIVPEQGNV